MNRLALRLSSHDLAQLINFLNYSLVNKRQIGYTKSPADRLILAGLAELLHKLSSANTCFKSTYKLQINLSQGLALQVHCMKTKGHDYHVDTLLMNNLIGIVDQKTA